MFSSFPRFLLCVLFKCQTLLSFALLLLSVNVKDFVQCSHFIQWTQQLAKMSSESQSQSSSSSSAESSSNFSAPIAKEAKRIRPKTAKVKVTKFRKTGFEEDEEIDECPPSKKHAPIFPTFFHQDLLINIPLSNNGKNSVLKTADEKTSLTELATVDTAASFLLALDGKNKRKVHFADDIGKKLVEAKYYERYLYLFQSNSTTTDDASVRNQHLNEAQPLKNAFDRFDGSDESSSNSFASVNEHTLEQEENVASTSQAYAKDFASFLDSLSCSTLTSYGSAYNTANQDQVESVFPSNPNPLFPTKSFVVDNVTSPQSNGGSKYDQNDNNKLLDPRYSKQSSSYKKHFYHQYDSSNRYERYDYQRERSLSRHYHHYRQSPDEYRGRSRRGRSPVEYHGRNRHSPSLDRYHSRSRDYGNYKSHRQHSSQFSSRSLSYEKKKKSHHSRTRKFSRSPSRDRF